MIEIINNDCLIALKAMPDNSVDSVVTDPPYGISFMGKKWDYDVPSVDIWKEVFRVLKPGGHVLCACGTRTQHRMTVNIEDAGFEIRDVVAWIYGSGFPKSLDISKQFDKINGTHTPELVPTKEGNKKFDRGTTYSTDTHTGFRDISKPSCDDAKQWEGWGTALKPSWEAWTVARKPLNSIQSSSESDKYFVSLLKQIKYELCQLSSFALIVEKSLKSSLKESEGGVSIAQWSVEENINIQVDLSVLMDMLQSESEINTNWSIVSSWLNILADHYEVMNTFTTLTKPETTTELRILNSMEWASIFQYITLAPKTIQSGLPLPVYDAESLFNVLRLKLQDIRSLIAQDNASLVHIDDKINTELWTLARKPLSEKTVASNVLKYGTGGINIDGCRVETGDKLGGGMVSMGRPKVSEGWDRPWMHDDDITERKKVESAEKVALAEQLGRFPANIIHDGSEEVEAEFAKAGERKVPDASQIGLGREGNYTNGIYGAKASKITTAYGDTGTASRFFYCAKASKSERNKGLDGFEKKDGGMRSETSGQHLTRRDGEDPDPVANYHPTVKPVALMRYLCRMITPKGGIVLDPFMGSGTTGIGAKVEGFSFIGIEREPDYCKIARARIDAWKEEVIVNEPTLF